MTVHSVQGVWAGGNALFVVEVKSKIAGCTVCALTLRAVGRAVAHNCTSSPDWNLTINATRTGTGISAGSALG